MSSKWVEFDIYEDLTQTNLNWPNMSGWVDWLLFFSFPSFSSSLLLYNQTENKGGRFHGFLPLPRRDRVQSWKKNMRDWCSGRRTMEDGDPERIRKYDERTRRRRSATKTRLERSAMRGWDEDETKCSGQRRRNETDEVLATVLQRGEDETKVRWSERQNQMHLAEVDGRCTKTELRWEYTKQILTYNYF